MKNVLFYTKHRKTYYYYPTPAELEEAKKLRGRQIRARQKAEEQAAEQEAFIHSKGYCPKCFLLKPLTGICPTCD